ncbi:hypothetical protein JX266_007485 [Neoarthrinium moseri]|uniref:uncharacterized protein n=1 Tax=Neoarthrinium moseri TaxID=1658444 RepID=UPI001FDC9560|nr:uncharacterized protein JN550_009021 [Neoarthrinium moseri]KAI1846280.1 hypothetical protein JX266_007485 [Neoarthrinium moseri]KAI1864464.1 hypothetical protein JN550_009021 [Neoarthrinium moseri]
MRVFVVALQAMLAAIVAGSPAARSVDLAGSGDRITKMSFEQVKAMVDASEGDDVPTRTKNDFPATAVLAAFGPKDTCMLDCNNDFKVAFDCWWRKNTRCWSCNLSSDDQSCLDQCRCVPFNSGGSKDVILIEDAAAVLADG